MHAHATRRNADGKPVEPTLDGLLAARSVSHPETVFLRFAEGDLTFADVHAAVQRRAAGFAGLGVRSGDVVPVLLPNSADFVITGSRSAGWMRLRASSTRRRAGRHWPTRWASPTPA